MDRSHVYRVGAALPDKDDPSKVMARLPDPLLEPEEDYERRGDVNNVVFPCGMFVRDGIVHVYYGAADKTCCLAWPLPRSTNSWITFWQLERGRLGFIPGIPIQGALTGVRSSL